MITVNNKDKAIYKDIKLKDVIGFALTNGYFFIDENEKYLISFWDTEITCSVTDLSSEGVDRDSTLNELVTKLNLCDIKDVVAVFLDESDFTLNLTW